VNIDDADLMIIGQSVYELKCALAFYGYQEMQHVIVSYMYKDLHFIAVLLAAE